MKVSSATTKVEADLTNIDVTNLKRTDFERIFGRDKRGVIQFPHYSHFLNPETTARVARLYMRDFEVLKYSLPR
jgi:hypothetical protein